MLVGLVTGKRRVELVEVPQPEPEPGKAVVEIDYCGICGTDIHAYLSGDPYNPAICGHEWTGRVSAVGPGVNHIKEVRLTASLAYLHEEFEMAKGLVADGRISCAPLHTDTVALDGLAGAFDRLAENPADIKILMNPRL